MRRLAPLFFVVLAAWAAPGAAHSSAQHAAHHAAQHRHAQPAAARGPRHVTTWVYYGGADQNEDVPAAWLAQHVDYAESDASQPEYVERFKAAGGHIAIAYSDPSYVPHCVPPFAPPAGACKGQIGTLNPPENAFAHDERGERVRRPDNAHMYQEALNPLSGAARGAYRAFTEEVVRRAPRLDEFLADDSGGPLRGGDGTPQSGLYYRFERPSTEIASDEAWIQGELAMLGSAARPVIVNGHDPATFKPSYDGIFLHAPNVRGAMLEGCFLTDILPRPVTDASRLWQREADGLLATTRLERIAACVQLSPELLKDPAARLYGLASWWLTYDERYSVIALLSGGIDGHAPFADEELVPRRPSRSPASIEELRDGTGGYVRTFAQCYQAGRTIGACAAVVNPSAVGTVPMPAAVAGYRRAAAFDPRSLYAGGTVRWTTVPRELGPSSAAILIR